MLNAGNFRKWSTITNNHPSNPQQPPATPSNPSIPIHSLRKTHQQVDWFRKILTLDLNQQKSPPIQRLTESAMCPKQYTFGLQRRLPLGGQHGICCYIWLYKYVDDSWFFKGCWTFRCFCRFVGGAFQILDNAYMQNFHSVANYVLLIFSLYVYEL